MYSRKKIHTLKSIMKFALAREYGFSPNLKDITLLESGTASSGDVIYIYAKVKDHFYTYRYNIETRKFEVQHDN